MKSNCEVNVVDAVMGAGKSSGIINLINQDNESKFLVITPYLDEVRRYKDSCPKKKFKTPMYDKTKLEDIKRLIKDGENIISTHSLFTKFDNELIRICKESNYTLIMDEVASVVDEHRISKQDYKVLVDTYVDINPETKQLIWKNEHINYSGKFDDEKRLCELGSLVTYGDALLVWVFPIEIFNAFKKIYILTYLFDFQMQKYYYDYYGIKPKYLTIGGDSVDTYNLIDYSKDINQIKYDYENLIHICDKEKLNMIGNKETDLSKSWYEKNKKSVKMTELKNNISNFFRNIRNDCSGDNIWTTFKDYKSSLMGKGYTKGFIPLNSRATNEYRNRTSVVYPVNRYLNPYVKNFFIKNNININEDGYALSEMLQLIWRSAIRDGKEIWIYIPSTRMRNLLEIWIKENSLKNPK